MDSNFYPDSMSIFRPPIIRSAVASLDRTLFSKTIPLSAARIANNKDLSKFRQAFQGSSEILHLERFSNIKPDPDPALAAKGSKCIILKPEVKSEDSTTWSEPLKAAVKAQQVDIISFDLKLDYSYWTYYDIMQSVLPEDAQEEIPNGFAVVGHIAHLNLRNEYLPYKKIIAEVIIDKNPMITTVINKIDDVGNSSEFRTFAYEVLAGPDDMNVEVSEEDCTFRFNYSKVYWNTRLQTEHRRLVEIFKSGEVVCDLMAGVGPFAIPAGKKGVFVWANDLNPDSVSSMEDAIKINKVQNFVRPFCENGRTFVHHCAADLLSLTATSQNTIRIPQKRPKSIPRGKFQGEDTVITIPQTINHFVMNLPATAIEFLSSFNGLYHNHEDLFSPKTEAKLPMIHVHCFSTELEEFEREICERISKAMDCKVKPGEQEMSIHEVRDVAPKKKMYCASFRLPSEVAFGPRRPE